MTISFPLRLGLWASLFVVAVAVYLGLQQQPPPQQPLQATHTFCYAQGITAKFSTEARATCFTVQDGLFVDVFTPESLPPDAHLHQGHAIPGLWDGVRKLPKHLVSIWMLIDHQTCLGKYSTATSYNMANSCTQ